MLVDDGIRIVLEFDIVGDGIHGARAVEGNARDDVLKRSGAEVSHKLFHPRTFQLEHRVRIALADELVSAHVFISDFMKIDVNAEIFLDVIHRFLDVRQSPQPQKVHFQHAQLLHFLHVELGGDILAAPLEGDVVRNGLRADDDARRVHGGVARQPLHAHRHVDDFPQVHVLVVDLPEFLDADVHPVLILFEPQALGDRGLAVHQLGDPIHLRIGDFIDARDVLDRRFGSERTERDDLRDLIRPVFSADVFHDFAAALVRKVDVEVRHADAFDVQKALEEEGVFQRIDVRDADRIGDDGRDAAASPRSHRDPDALGVVDEIPNDEIVFDETHRVDGVELVIEALADLRRNDGVALF